MRSAGVFDLNDSTHQDEWERHSGYVLGTLAGDLSTLYCDGTKQLKVEGTNSDGSGPDIPPGLMTWHNQVLV